MGLQIKRKSDKRVIHACTHNCADIPNGVTVCSTELVPGIPLLEGTAIAKGSDGLYHVEKTARVAAAIDATTVKVAKGSHFKAGDVVMAAAGKTAVAITAVNRDDAAVDVLTLGAAVGTLKEGDVLELAAATATKGALAYSPLALTGDSYDVEELNNHLVTAVTIGQFKESVIPPVTSDITAALKGIVLI